MQISERRPKQWQRIGNPVFCSAWGIVGKGRMQEEVTFASEPADQETVHITDSGECQTACGRQTYEIHRYMKRISSDVKICRHCLERIQKQARRQIELDIMRGKVRAAALRLESRGNEQ